MPPKSLWLAATFMSVGTALALCVYCWLTVRAFRESRAQGIALIALFPLGGLLYAIGIAERHRTPLWCFVAAWTCNILGMAFLDFH